MIILAHRLRLRVAHDDTVITFGGQKSERMLIRFALGPLPALRFDFRHKSSLGSSGSLVAGNSVVTPSHLTRNSSWHVRHNASSAYSPGRTVSTEPQCGHGALITIRLSGAIVIRSRRRALSADPAEIAVAASISFLVFPVCINFRSTLLRDYGTGEYE